MIKGKGRGKGVILLDAKLEKKNRKNSTLFPPPIQPSSTLLSNLYLANLPPEEVCLHLHHFRVSSHTLRVPPSVVKMRKTLKNPFLWQVLSNLTIHVAVGELVALWLWPAKQVSPGDNTHISLLPLKAAVGHLALEHLEHLRYRGKYSCEHFSSLWGIVEDLYCTR